MLEIVTALNQEPPSFEIREVYKYMFLQAAAVSIADLRYIKSLVYHFSKSFKSFLKFSLKNFRKSFKNL